MRPRRRRAGAATAQVVTCSSRLLVCSSIWLADGCSAGYGADELARWMQDSKLSEYLEMCEAQGMRLCDVLFASEEMLR